MVPGAARAACAHAAGSAGEGLLQEQPFGAGGLGLPGVPGPVPGTAPGAARLARHGTARHLCRSWLRQALLSPSAVPGISQGTATAWRGLGHLVSCCSPACCCPRLRGASPAPAPAPASVRRRTPRRHRPSTMQPGEGTPGLGPFTAVAGAAPAPQRALAPTRSSPLRFAFCPPQRLARAGGRRCPRAAAPASPLRPLLRAARAALLLPPVPAPASDQRDHPER